MNSSASFLEGNEIQDLGGGRFQTTAASLRYSPLDQYLMGLRGADEVPAFFYVSDVHGRDGGSRRARPRSGVAFGGNAARPLGGRRGRGHRPALARASPTRPRCCASPSSSCPPSGPPSRRRPRASSSASAPPSPPSTRRAPRAAARSTRGSTEGPLGPPLPRRTHRRGHRRRQRHRRGHRARSSPRRGPSWPFSTGTPPASRAPPRRSASAAARPWPSPST